MAKPPPILRARSRRLLRRAQRLDPPQQRVVLLARADGDADLVVEARLIEVSDQNALPLKAEVRRFAAAVGGGGENEVGVARQDLPAHRRQLAAQTLPLGFHVI